MRFCDISGLEEVKLKLINSVKKDHLAHAILLSGVSGSQNLPLALAFATYLNCLDRQDNDACGKCASCVKNEKFIHPDLNFVFPVTTKAGVKPRDVVSKTFLGPWRQFLSDKPYGGEDVWASFLESQDKQFNISKEESRQIISNLSLKAFEGEYKIMLIWLPEYMHPNSANGILKILEEPSEKTVFLLVSNDSEKLLSTILSRVLTIFVRKPTESELTNVLEVDFDIPADKAEHLARISEGNLAQALSLSERGSDYSLNFRDWLLSCHKFSRGEMVTFADKFAGLSKLSQHSFLTYGISILREVLVHEFGSSEVSRVSAGETEFVSKLSQILSSAQIEKLSKSIGETIYLLERNANVRIAFMELSITVAKVFNQK